MKLEIKNLKKSFGDKEILHGLSFSVENGKALGLLGRNGAGKTTTIRILMDVFKANSGEIYLDGKPFKPSHNNIGYLPEERGLYPKKVIQDQLIYLAELKGMRKKDALVSISYWFERLEITQYLKVKLDTLSKGNQQKVQLAQSLVCDPEIVILDEPFSGLDPVNSQVLKDVIKELIAKDKVVIFSSHQMSYVEEFCEEICILNHGDIVLSGNIKEIKREYGEGKLILRSASIDHASLKDLFVKNLSSYVTTCDLSKEGVIITLRKDTTKNILLKALIDANIDIDLFGNYEPSLNDLFIMKAGDDK